MHIGCSMRETGARSRGAGLARKRAVAVLLALLATCTGALAACNGQPQENAFGSKDAKAELHVVLDSALEGAWSGADGIEGGGTAGEGNLENLSFATPIVADADAGAAAVEEALDENPGTDVVFARGTVVDRLVQDGYVHDNATALNIAEIPVLDNEYLVAARAEGDSAELPETRLIGGADDAPSSEWRLAYLADWDGTLAVAQSTALSGQAFNQALAAVGLYSDDSGEGGEYAESVRGKVRVVESAKDALALVRDGKADAAFVYTFDLDGAQGVEQFYEVPLELYSLRPDFKGAVLSASPNPDAARWYLNVLYKLI